MCVFKHMPVRVLIQFVSCLWCIEQFLTLSLFLNRISLQIIPWMWM